MLVAPSVAPLFIGYLFYRTCGNVKNVGGSLVGSLAHWLSVLWEMLKIWKMSVAPTVAPLLIGSLFYRKCGKCEKYWWLPRWLPCSLVLCFMGNVENVKNIGGSLGGFFAHWLFVPWKMWKLWKMWKK